jgi:hypothetical protein
MSPGDERLNASREYKPPLTEDIFSARRSFQGILERYPDASALAETIRVKPMDKALEAMLREFSDSFGKCLSTSRICLRRLARTTPNDNPETTRIW